MPDISHMLSSSLLTGKLNPTVHALRPAYLRSEIVDEAFIVGALMLEGWEIMGCFHVSLRALALAEQASFGFLCADDFEIGGGGGLAHLVLLGGFQLFPVMPMLLGPNMLLIGASTDKLFRTDLTIKILLDTILRSLLILKL